MGRVFLSCHGAGASRFQDAIARASYQRVATVNAADVFIGVFGSAPDADAPNDTEDAYRRARKRGIACFIFLQYELPDDVRIVRRAILGADVERTHRTERYTVESDLTHQIFEGLERLRKRGYFLYAAPDLKPQSAHPYVAPHQFVGRASELAQIEAWVASEDLLLVLQAVGGMGKSALAWHWTQQHRRDFDAVVWWNFYASDGAFENFTIHTLAHLTEQPVHEVRMTPRSQRYQLLQDALATRRTLLVLDGFERALTAYNTLDAPMLDETEIDDAPVRRACIDPRHGAFLRDLLTIDTVKVLLTTRLMPHDLEQTYDGAPIPGVRVLPLAGVYPSGEVLRLMQERGVRGHDDAVLRFAELFGNHALTLNIIAGLLRHHPPVPGDTDLWASVMRSDMAVEALDVASRRKMLLSKAISRLSESSRTLLGRLSAFRYAVGYDVLRAINPHLPQKKGLHPSDDSDKPGSRKTSPYSTRSLVKSGESDTGVWNNPTPSSQDKETAGDVRKLNRALADLEDAGLLMWDRATNRYDLHPLVRGHTYQHLQETERRTAHRYAQDYYEALPREDLDSVETVDDLRRSLEIYYALVGAGEYGEAAGFFSLRLAQVLLQELGAYETILQLLSPLFPNGLGVPSNWASHEERSYFVKVMAVALRELGRDDEALDANITAIELDIKTRNIRELCVSLCNYGSVISDFGRLEAARYVFRQASSLAEIVEDDDQTLIGDYYLMTIAVNMARWEEVASIHRAFQKRPPRQHPQALQYRAGAEILAAQAAIMRGEDAVPLLDAAKVLADDARDQRLAGHIARRLGEDALNKKLYHTAQKRFQDALSVYHRLGSDDVYAIYARLALVCAHLGDRDGAETWIARTGEQSSKREVIVSTAETALALGDHERAQSFALRGCAASWADGPPFCFSWYWARSREVLFALGETDEAAIQAQLGLKPYQEQAAMMPHQTALHDLIEEIKRGKP